MKKTKRVTLIMCFAIIMILGLILIFNSPDLAEIKSRRYDGNNSYSTYDADISRNMVSLVSTGCVISLLAGYGLITIIVKD